MRRACAGQEEDAGGENRATQGQDEFVQEAWEEEELQGTRTAYVSIMFTNMSQHHSGTTHEQHNSNTYTSQQGSIIHIPGSIQTWDQYSYNKHTNVFTPCNTPHHISNHTSPRGRRKQPTYVQRLEDLEHPQNSTLRY